MPIRKSWVMTFPPLNSEMEKVRICTGAYIISLTSIGPPPKKPQRPLANPDLFKPNSPAASDRKVSFQNGPPEEMDDLYSGSSKPSRQQVPSGKSSRWQPLSAVEPSPVAENDPFSLGDSDDDKDSRVKDNRSDEAERLQPSTVEAMAGSVGDNPKNASGTEMGQGTKT